MVSELPSLLLSKVWIQEVRLLRGVRNHIYYIRGPLRNLIKLPNLITITEANMDSITREREAALVELLIAIEARECELSEIASTYESINSGDKIISKDKV